MRLVRWCRDGLELTRKNGYRSTDNGSGGKENDYSFRPRLCARTGSEKTTHVCQCADDCNSSRGASLLAEGVLYAYSYGLGFTS